MPKKITDKLCTRCGIEPRYNGRAGVCKKCLNILKKEHSDEMRAKIAQYKLANGCTDCGYKGHHAALEFDHIKGFKRFCISNMTRHSWENIMLEIAKCEIVCANCHKIRTWKRLQDSKDNYR